MSELEAKAVLEALRELRPALGLAPKAARSPELSKRIRALSLADGGAPLALRSALLLWNGELDASHELSQDIHTPTGSLLHGIMHRMEGDYGNAEYWFRRVGTHPCYRAIGAAAGGIAGDGAWDPYRFNRAVERAVRSGDAAAAAPLANAQHVELDVVTTYCFDQAFRRASH